MDFDDLREQRDWLVRVAADIAATEMAVFAYHPKAFAETLDLLYHVRPDGSDETVRQTAIDAFREVIRPCIEQGREGAIEVEAASVERPNPQYCLVALARRRDGTVAGVAAFVVRRRDQADAVAALRTIEDKLAKRSGS